jgi:hypothetical protein
MMTSRLRSRTVNIGTKTCRAFPTRDSREVKLPQRDMRRPTSREARPIFRLNGRFQKCEMHSVLCFSLLCHMSVPEAICIGFCASASCATCPCQRLSALGFVLQPPVTHVRARGYLHRVLCFGLLCNMSVAEAICIGCCASASCATCPRHRLSA